MLDNLESFAGKIARHKTRKARNPVGRHIYISPGLPSDWRCPRNVTADEWREINGMHRDARQMIRDWSSPPS